MRHDATITWTYELRDQGYSPGVGGYQGICPCGWNGPTRGETDEDREWAQDDCTWHETQMRIEKDCDHSVVGNCPHYS